MPGNVLFTSENMDYLGRECAADSMCERHEEDYYWCKIDAFSWGYCGLVMDDKNHFGSYTDALCYDHCEQRNENYYWCNTAQKWDYCSPSENTDYKNNQCKGPCGKQNQKYRWCWLKNGSWGYCGPVETKMFIYRSMYNYVCIDECQYYEKGDYYWCHTAKDWDYCSPDVDVTYKGEPCRSDHFCDQHGYGYNWCWTKSSYDYCGLIEPGECTYITSRHHNRRAIDDESFMCIIEDKENNIATIFTAEPDPKYLIDGSNWREEAETLISRWEDYYLLDQARSNLIHSEHLRINLQGVFKRNNQFYYNLQIQLNIKRKPGESTTVSQIIVPNISARYMRRASWIASDTELGFVLRF